MIDDITEHSGEDKNFINQVKKLYRTRKWTLQRCISIMQLIIKYAEQSIIKDAEQYRSNKAKT